VQSAVRFAAIATVCILVVVTGCSRPPEPAPAAVSSAPVTTPHVETGPVASEPSTPAPAVVSSPETIPDEPTPIPAQPVNLLVNGSFEGGPQVGQWREIEIGSTQLPGWAITGKIDIIGTFWKAADGKRSIDLNGPPDGGPGGLKQTFITQPGKTYYVVFALAGNPGAGPAEKGLEVRAAGKTKTFSFNTTGRNGGNMGWAIHSWEFTADAAETTLEFVSTVQEPGGAGPALDRVWVSGAKPPDDVYRLTSEPLLAATTPPAPVVGEKNSEKKVESLLKSSPCGAYPSSMCMATSG